MLPYNNACHSPKTKSSRTTGYNLILTPMMYSVGGPGGPGTVYFWNVGQPSTLIVDNYGKSTYVKRLRDPDGTCSMFMDVLAQGIYTNMNLK